MADFGAPAQPNYNAPDGLQTLGNLMGLKRAQQGLVQQQLQIQGQESQNQSLAAGATVDTQNAKEKMAGAQLLADPIGNGLTDEDGTPLKGARAKIMSVMPTTGDKNYADLLSAATNHVQFKSAALKLRGDVKSDIASRLAGVAADKNAGLPEIHDALDLAQKDYADTPAAGDVNTIVRTSKAAIDGAAKNGGVPGAKQTIMGISRGGLGNAGITGTGGVAAPTAGTMNLGNKVVPTVQQPALSGGALSEAPGAQTVNIPPGWSMTEDPVTHNKYMINQQTGESKPFGQPFKAPGNAAPPQRTPGEGEANAHAVIGRSEGVTNRVEQAKVAANNTVGAQDALSRAKALLESPSTPKTGGNFESIRSLKNLLSSVGVDTQGADDMNTLTKNLARYEAARATQAGLGGTDAARELAHKGSPSTQLDNKALLGIVRQSLASEKAIASYAKVQSKTADPETLIKNENDFRNIPHLIEAHEYGMMRNADEAAKFRQEHNISPEQMAASRAAIKEFDSR